MITIDWQLMPPHNLDDTGHPDSTSSPELFYPRITGSRTVSCDELFALASHGSGCVFHRGELSSALYHIVRAIVQQLQQGNAVELPDLGTLRLQIEADKDMHRDELSHTGHIRCKGVAFKPSAQLLSQLDDLHFKWLPTGSPSSHPTDEQVLAVLHHWFATHDSIKCKELSSLLHLKQTATQQRINRLLSDGILHKSGSGKNTHYLPSTSLSCT